MEKKVNKIVVEVSYTGNNYAATMPLLLGCVTTGDTLDEIKKNIGEVVEFHLQGMRESGETLPEEFNGEYEFDYNISDELLEEKIMECLKNESAECRIKLAQYTLIVLSQMTIDINSKTTTVSTDFTYKNQRRSAEMVVTYKDIKE